MMEHGAGEPLCSLPPHAPLRVAGGVGGGVARRSPVQRFLPDRPPPPTPPHRFAGGGETDQRSLCSLVRDDELFRFKFQIADARPHSRGTICPRLAFCCPSKRGSRECRVRAAPAVSCAKWRKETHTSIQVQRRQSGIPCAMALRLISCSPRRIGLSCHRRLRKGLIGPGRADRPPPT